MKCPQCNVPEGNEAEAVLCAPGVCWRSVCRGTFFDHGEEIACLRRALANRDGEIAALKTAADSSFEFRAALVEDMRRTTDNNERLLLQWTADQEYLIAATAESDRLRMELDGAIGLNSVDREHHRREIEELKAEHADELRVEHGRCEFIANERDVGIAAERERAAAAQRELMRIESRAFNMSQAIIGWYRHVAEGACECLATPEWIPACSVGVEFVAAVGAA